MGQIAEALGLDTAKCASQKKQGGEEDGDEEFGQSIDQARSPDMFENVTPFSLRCPTCSEANEGHAALPYQGMFKWTTDGKSNFRCHSASCAGLVRPAQAGSQTVYNESDVWKIKNQLSRAVREETKKYYKREMRCNDSTCKCTTRQMSVRGTKCPVTGCAGTMEFTISDKDLYEQLRYLSSLFQYEPSLKRLKELKEQNPARYKEATGNFQPHELEAAREIARHAQNLCKQSGYHYVDFARLGKNMGFLFKQQVVG